MTREKVWRYYCDHCGKGGCAGGHIKKHEAHCIRNPERSCRLCATAQNEQARPVAALIEALAAGLPALREKAGNCPVCILAAIVQDKKRPDYDHGDPETNDPGDYVEFDFKAELAAFWRDHNERGAGL